MLSISKLAGPAGMLLHTGKIKSEGFQKIQMGVKHPSPDLQDDFQWEPSI